MNSNFKQLITEACKAQHIQEVEVIQELWSGYGQIIRYRVEGSSIPGLNSVIVKNVRLPKQTKHPRGWNTDLSHERKVHSYEVETQWYKHWNDKCDDACRTPHCLELAQEGDEVLMVMEDLDDSGFSERRSSVSMDDIKICLSWLANFHATFLNKKPEGLWKSGTYWHLQTRPDELEELDDVALKNTADAIDKALSECQYTTLVHGDAKLANFCFGKNSDGSVKVAGVDFQYVGGGCGMKDVAYFIGSCLYEEDCERHEKELLDCYFEELKRATNNRYTDINTSELCNEWRSLYYTAWADFHRFLKGWSPGHWKINSYSERVTKQVIEQINS